MLAGCWLRESEAFYEVEIKSIPAVSGRGFFAIELNV